jgi:hypothetical protein
MKVIQMRFFRSMLQFLTVLTILLLPGCATQKVLTPALSAGTPAPITGTQATGSQPLNSPGTKTSTSDIASPATTSSVTETPPLSDFAWRTVPIIPVLDEHLIQIFQDGQTQGRNPHNFSVIGDCQSIPFVFMGPFGRGILAPDSGESYLWDAINQFKDSFNHESVTSRGGFTAASILNPLQADPHYCTPGETPLTCEYRLNNPAYVFITLETWLDPKTIDRYEIYLRQILDYVLAKGSIPILITKADSAEVFNGKYVINPAIVQVAHDYDVPVVNFWQAAQYLDNAGIDPAREGFHLSQDGYNLKNILALRALYNVWKYVDTGNSKSSQSSTPTPAPTQQATTNPAIPLTLTIPDCAGSCIFFGTTSSHDGVAQSQGVYAYAFTGKKLIPVLGQGYNLQDVSADGKQLLVNDATHLYDVNLATGSSSVISESFFSLGRQDAYWNADASQSIYLDQKQPILAGTGYAFNLFPTTRANELYFESGKCTALDSCQSNGAYQQIQNQVPMSMDTTFHLVFSPNGKYLAYLNSAAATADNYFHIGYLMLQEPDLGVNSSRVFYFPKERGFMISPDVRDFAFSPDNSKIFIIYDVYSAYFEKSLHIKTYVLNVKTGVLYDYGKIDGPSGSLSPRVVWSPHGDSALFFMTSETTDNQYSLGVYQTVLNTEQRLVPFDQGIITSNEYFHITNIYWR